MLKHFRLFFRLSETVLEIDYALSPIVNGAKNKNIKNRTFSVLSKYQVPNGFGFSPKASGFYPFGDATALAGEGGVSAVVWLIQASASNHKPKGRFFWFVVCVVCLKSDMPHH